MKTFIFLLLVTSKILSQSNLHLAHHDGGVLHVYAGSLISAGAGARIYSQTKKPMFSALMGFIAGSMIGVGKEVIYDRLLKRGVCDNSDAYKTMWGSAIGSLCLRVGIDIKQKNEINEADYEGMNINEDLITKQ